MPLVPPEQNGLGFRISEAEKELSRIESVFGLLPDIPEIYGEWKRLILHYGISGVKTHDARLVASMIVHRVSTILTLDASDFARYVEIAVLHPKNVPKNTSEP